MIGPQGTALSNPTIRGSLKGRRVTLGAQRLVQPTSISQVISAAQVRGSSAQVFFLRNNKYSEGLQYFNFLSVVNPFMIGNTL